MSPEPIHQGVMTVRLARPIAASGNRSIEAGQLVADLSAPIAVPRQVAAHAFQRNV
jgi:hypothetical protein